MEDKEIQTALIKEIGRVFGYEPTYTKTSYTAVKKLIKHFKTGQGVVDFALAAASFTDYPYVIYSPRSLYEKIEKIQGRIKASKPRYTFEGQPVREWGTGYQVQGADGQWRTYAGDRKDIVKNY